MQQSHRVLSWGVCIYIYIHIYIYIYIDAPARSSSAHPSFKFCDTVAYACCATLNATAVRISVEYQSTMKPKASIRKHRESKIKMNDPNTNMNGPTQKYKLRQDSKPS